MKLTRLQVATVKQMARSLKPVEAKIDRLQQKKLELEEEMLALEAQVVSIHAAIESFTGGLTLTEVLNPEAVPSTEMEEGAYVDGEAIADEIEVTNVFNDAISVGTFEDTLNVVAIEEIEEPQDMPFLP